MRGLYHDSLARNLEEAKHRLTIPEIWRRLNLPGSPDISCRSPFREDRNASFSIFANGSRWMDHATGEKGDAVDFIAKSQNLPTSAALKHFLEMAGVRGGIGPRSIGHILRYEMRQIAPVTASECAPVTGAITPDFSADKPINGTENSTVRASMALPPVHGGTKDERAALMSTRKLPSEKGLSLAEERGLLRFGPLRDQGAPTPSWFVTDSRRMNAQARRLDGAPWQSLPSAPKARTLKGALASWPIGAADIASRALVILCEGGPDLLAALTIIACHAPVIESVGAVAMIGASLAIHAEALPILAGKCVRIVPHLDKAGASAALKWDAQLSQVGASVSWFDLRPFVPAGGKDLNDALTHNADALNALVRPDHLAKGGC